MEGALVDLLSFGVMRSTVIYGEPLPSYSVDPTRAVRLAIQRLCQDLLPEIIGLTDAFGFTDWDLDRQVTILSAYTFLLQSYHVFFSALGVYNGKVYEALWERAQAEPLNRTEVPAAYGVRMKILGAQFFFFHSFNIFRPLLDLSFSAVRD